MDKLIGNITELHLEVGLCYGSIYLDNDIDNRYIPFLSNLGDVIDTIRKGSGHYVLEGGWSNNGGDTYETSKVIFYVDKVTEFEQINPYIDCKHHTQQGLLEGGTEWTCSYSSCKYDFNNVNPKVEE